MKKEYLDYLYELRGIIQAEIDVLVKQQEEPRDAKCQGCDNPIARELIAKRKHIFDTNKSIERYLEIHK